MPTSHLKKIPLHQGMVVDHVMGDGQFSSTDSLFATGSMTTGVPILPLLPENTIVGGNGNLALNSLGNNWPIEPTSHTEFFPVPNLISNMFDGNKATAFRSVGPTSNKASLLIFDFGREVLPGKIVITFPHIANNPNFAAGGNMNISFHDELTSNNANQFKDHIFPLNSFNDSNVIQTAVAAGVYKARVYQLNSTADPDPNKATSIIGDDETFLINEFVITNPTNTGDTEGTGVVMTRGRRYMTISFSNTTNPNYFGISNIEFFEKVNGLDYLKQHDVEFDDALLDLQGWKNPRYYGSKLTGKSINKFRKGDISYGKNPVVENKTTAMYIVDTVIGGTEDPQFSQIKAHSYLGIKQILIIDEQNETVEVIDRNSEDFEPFQRYITTDFPTGGKFRARIIDNKSIQNNLKKEYFVKFNKGYLLRSFNFKLVPDRITPSVAGGIVLKTIKNTDTTSDGDGVASSTIFNPIFLYGDHQHNILNVAPFGGFNAEAGTNLEQFSQSININSGSLNFNFANSTSVNPQNDGGGFSPRFDSSSIFMNKFTRQYYSGSSGIINDEPIETSFAYTRPAEGETIPGIINSAFFKASQFIMLDTLTFLKENENTTELYLSLLKGNKDFAPNFNDERSIGLFEVSAETQVTNNTVAYGFLPTNQVLKLRGKKEDGRFYPTIPSYSDRFHKNYIIAFGTNVGADYFAIDPNPGNAPPTQDIRAVSDTIFTNQMFIQGGQAGSKPAMRYGEGAATSVSNLFNVDTTNHTDWSTENDYSGSYYNAQSSTNILPLKKSLSEDDHFEDEDSLVYNMPQFDYDLSFLDKDHTLIANIDKETELFDGIGSAGLVLVPEQISPNLKFNIDYWLNKAGILDKKVKRTPRRPERGR